MLSTSTLGLVLRIAQEVAERRDPAALGLLAPQLLSEHFDCGAAYFEYDPTRDAVGQVVGRGPRPSALSTLGAQIRAHAATDPWPVEAERRRDWSARRWSDFLSPRQLAENPMYRAMYSQIPCHHAAFGGLPRRGSMRRALLLGSTRRDLSDAGLVELEQVRRALGVLMTLPTSGPPTAPPGPPALTVRQRQVLRLAAAGHTDTAIGSRLGISVRTVQKHVADACHRLGARSRTQAVACADRAGLL